MTLHAGGGVVGGVGGLFDVPLEVTCKFNALDVALPGLGFITATEKVPADAALPVAVNCVDDTNVVASGEPAKSTCAPLTNPLPTAVIVNVPDEIDDGAILVSVGIGFSKVTALLPKAVASAALTARTVTALELGAAPGAVYAPDELIVPVAEEPPVTPFTCQLTALFDDPVTVAVNVCDAPGRRFAVPGETETAMPEAEGDDGNDGEVVPVEFEVPFVVPVHPVNAMTVRTKIARRECRKENILVSEWRLT
jgi:hypothetical protein